MKSTRLSTWERIVVRAGVPAFILSLILWGPK